MSDQTVEIPYFEFGTLHDGKRFFAGVRMLVRGEVQNQYRSPRAFISRKEAREHCEFMRRRLMDELHAAGSLTTYVDLAKIFVEA